MRDLDAKGNPYAGQYSEFDRWARANAIDPKSDKFDEYGDADNAGGYEIYLISVDDKGYVVPMDKSLEWRLNPPAGYEQSPCSYSYFAGARPEPDIKSWLVDSVVKHRVAAVGALPAWLVDNPPCWACPLSGGEFLTIGALGSGAGFKPGVNAGVLYNLPRIESSAHKQPYCRYGSEGEFMGEMPADSEWWRLAFDDFDEKCREVAGELDYVYREYNGTIVVYEQTSWQELALFDFMGNELPMGEGKHGSKRLLTWIYGGNIPLIYQAQQQKGDNYE